MIGGVTDIFEDITGEGYLWVLDNSWRWNNT